MTPQESDVLATVGQEMHLRHPRCGSREHPHDSFSLRETRPDFLYYQIFWQNIGATIGTAVLGSLLAKRLPEEISTRISSLSLPPEAQQFIPKGGGAAT